MWILNGHRIFNTDNICYMAQDSPGKLIIRDVTGLEYQISDVPENALHQIWMAHKKGQDLFVIESPTTE